GDGSDVARIDERPFARSEWPRDDALLGDAVREPQQILHEKRGSQVGDFDSRSLRGAFDLAEPLQGARAAELSTRTDAGKLHDPADAGRLGRHDAPQV